jgi:hypothetical protein
VHVDEARRDHETARVDLFGAAPGHPSHGRDAIARDRNVALERRAPAAVDDRAAADDEIGVHRRHQRRCGPVSTCTKPEVG